MTNHTLILILLEIAVIIGLARLVGLAFVRIRQPPVVGEIVAGIMLGPSLLGLVSPTAFATLFPPATAPFLSPTAISNRRRSGPWPSPAPPSTISAPGCCWPPRLPSRAPTAWPTRCRRCSILRCSSC